jgi:D-alanyl-D-alanine carboxypeptidase (penicillin-binding protein 5/6)
VSRPAFPSQPSGRRAPARTATLLASLVCLLGGAAGSAWGAKRPPDIAAPQAVLVEPATGDVLYRRAADEPRPVASATKLMTALLVLERVSLDDVFRAVPYRGLADESRLGLRPGERMQVRDLLRALLLVSANDAAATLAVGTSGSLSAFVDAMNQRARQLGLAHTHYANPIGLDAGGNYSSAADLVKLTSAVRRIAFFRRTVSLPRARLATGDVPRVVDNRNDLVGRARWVDGVKTGHTPLAGYVLVGSATRGGVTVLSAVLGDSSRAARDADTLALLRYGLEQYHVASLVRPGRVLATAAIRYRERDRVALVASRSVRRIVRRGERPTLTLHGPRRVEGPLAAGAVVGRVVVRLRGRVVARVPLVTAADVPKVGLAERAAGLLLKPGTLAVVGALTLGTVGLAGARRRRLRRRRAARRGMEAGAA